MVDISYAPAAIPDPVKNTTATVWQEDDADEAIQLGWSNTQR